VRDDRGTAALIARWNGKNWKRVPCASAATPAGAHPGGADHFVEAVTTGTAVARFAERRKPARPPSLAVLPLG
jgi:hypothetical protein